MGAFEGITEREMEWRLGQDDGSGLYVEEILADRQSKAPAPTDEDRADPFYRGIDEALKKSHDYLRARVRQQKTSTIPLRAQRNTMQG
jgi:hypothetical protein